MKDSIKIGYIGLGQRGSNMLDCALSKMEDVDIVYLCDLIQDKIDAAQTILQKNGKPQAKETRDYRDILNDADIDAVFLFTGWDGRVELAKQFMLAGKYTAIEVGCADTLEQCYDLISVYEQTGTPIMMLENICYGKRELAAYNMIKQGLFGEVIHCTGGYCHYLNQEDLFWEMLLKEPKAENVSHYRLGHYIHENCENYPTHELGPISKWLGINRGNRFVSLSSFASKSRGLKQFAKDKFGEESEYAKIDYKQGDIVTTVLTCENGVTVVLTLDTTLPRLNYSRNICIRGTRGMLSEDFKTVFIEGMEENTRNNEEEFLLKYEHPLQREVREFETEQTKIAESFGMHSNGVDWMIFRAFIESVKRGTNTPIDAYDTATWLAVGPLSKLSIEKGGMPMEFPDFTNGKYKNREPIVNSKYCLDDIVVDTSYTIYDCLSQPFQPQ